MPRQPELVTSKTDACSAMEVPGNGPDPAKSPTSLGDQPLTGNGISVMEIEPIMTRKVRKNKPKNSQKSAKGRKAKAEKTVEMGVTSQPRQSTPYTMRGEEITEAPYVMAVGKLSAEEDDVSGEMGTRQHPLTYAECKSSSESSSRDSSADVAFLHGLMSQASSELRLALFQATIADLVKAQSTNENGVHDISDEQGCEEKGQDDSPEDMKKESKEPKANEEDLNSKAGENGVITGGTIPVIARAGTGKDNEGESHGTDNTKKHSGKKEVSMEATGQKEDLAIGQPFDEHKLLDKIVTEAQTSCSEHAEPVAASLVVSFPKSTNEHKSLEKNVEEPQLTSSEQSEVVAPLQAINFPEPDDHTNSSGTSTSSLAEASLAMLRALNPHAEGLTKKMEAVQPQASYPGPAEAVASSQATSSPEPAGHIHSSDTSMSSLAEASLAMLRSINPHAEGLTKKMEAVQTRASSPGPAEAVASSQATSSPKPVGHIHSSETSMSSLAEASLAMLRSINPHAEGLAKKMEALSECSRNSSMIEASSSPDALHAQGSVEDLTAPTVDDCEMPSLATWEETATVAELNRAEDVSEGGVEYASIRKQARPRKTKRPARLSQRSKSFGEAEFQLIVQPTKSCSSEPVGIIHGPPVPLNEAPNWCIGIETREEDIFSFIREHITSQLSASTKHPLSITANDTPVKAQYCVPEMFKPEKAAEHVGSDADVDTSFETGSQIPACVDQLLLGSTGSSQSVQASDGDIDMGSPETHAAKAVSTESQDLLEEGEKEIPGSATGFSMSPLAKDFIPISMQTNTASPEVPSHETLLAMGIGTGGRKQNLHSGGELIHQAANNREFQQWKASKVTSSSSSVMMSHQASVSGGSQTFEHSNNLAKGHVQPSNTSEKIHERSSCSSNDMVVNHGKKPEGCQGAKPTSMSQESEQTRTSNEEQRSLPNADVGSQYAVQRHKNGLGQTTDQPQKSSEGSTSLIEHRRDESSSGGDYTVYSFADLSHKCNWCGQALSDMDPNTILCNGCGPFSATRYCSGEHLFRDLTNHWRACNSVLLPFQVDRSTLPAHHEHVAPAIENRHGLSNFVLHRQRAWSAYRHGDADYAIFSDWRESRRAGRWVETIVPTHGVRWDDSSPMKDIVNRVLNVCFYDHQFVRAPIYLYRLIRFGLREQKQWTRELEIELCSQFWMEFGVDPQTVCPAADSGDALMHDWYGPSGLQAVVEVYEAHVPVLRLWRREHPDPALRSDAWRRYSGEVVPGAVPVGLNGFSAGWNGNRDECRSWLPMQSARQSYTTTNQRTL